jgi:hypothetical protein
MVFFKNNRAFPLIFPQLIKPSMLLGLHLDQTHINLWLYFYELIPEFRDRCREPATNATAAPLTARSPFPGRCAFVQRQDSTGWRMSLATAPARLPELPVHATG